jgi:Cu/Ag efflux pump CusA
MIVALTVAPALSLLVFSWGSPGRRESPILRRLSPRYDGALSRLVRAPRATLVVCGVLVVVGLAALPLLDTSLVPSFKDRDVLVRLEGPPGTSESKMSATTAQLGSQLKTIAGVEDVGATVGRAVTGNQIVDVNSSELSVRLAPSANYESAMASIEDVVGRAQQDVQGSVETYSDQALRDVGALYTGEQPTSGNGLDVLTGVHEPLVVRIYGQDLGVLRGEAEKVRGLVSGVDGVVDPRVKLGPERPVIDIETKLSEALHYGLKSGDIRRAEAALVQGIQVGSIFRGQKVFEVVVLGEPAVRESVASVRNMLIDTPGGGHVRLGKVADVRTGTSPTDIKREAVSRYVDVKADVSGRSLGAVAGDVNARLANVKFPLEYHAQVIQQSTSREINLDAIAGFGVVVVIAIFLLFQAALRSWRLAALVFLTLPVALAGGALAALIDGAALPLGALVAFLAILGLAARNGTMLIHNCQRLRTDAAHPFDADLVRRGAGERLAPVLTSASALALVALPFVIMGNVAGLEIVHPMAVVLLGGLVTTTLLGLFVLPALYLRFGAGAQPEPASETPLPPAVAAERSRQFGRASERRTGAARPEQTAEAGANPPSLDGEDASPGRRGE